MNIVERGRQFLHALRDLASRTAWGWRRCPRCGDTLTRCWGTYTRHPWFLDGRRGVAVRRHFCTLCRKTYSEQSALLVRGGWYAREVRRCAIDHWQHVGTSVRKTAEHLRSLLGHQERWLVWRPLDAPPTEEGRCRLSPGTVERWLDGAGRRAQETVVGQLRDVPSSGQLATDGLWARLRGKGTKVVLLLADSVSGVIWPPVVVEGEEAPSAWQQLFARAEAAGLVLREIRGVTSDGAKGLEAYLARSLDWVSHQRCVFHLWRSFAGEIAAQVAAAATGLMGEAAHRARREARADIVAAVRAVLDAPSHLAAQRAFERLRARGWGHALARLLDEHLDAALAHLLDYNQGLVRTGPEWLWRDFRLRLGHGRNQGSDARLERSALLFAIYHNFEPAQQRREHTRHYRHPGLSPLWVAGVPPNDISYFDALNV
jgi:hypothetical protein